MSLFGKGVVKVWFYTWGDECLGWWMLEVVNVWGGECLRWWTSGVVNVWFYTGGGERLGWWMSGWWTSYNPPTHARGASTIQPDGHNRRKRHFQNLKILSQSRISFFVIHRNAAQLWKTWNPACCDWDKLYSIQKICLLMPQTLAK